MIHNVTMSLMSNEECEEKAPRVQQGQGRDARQLARYDGRRVGDLQERHVDPRGDRRERVPQRNHEPRDPRGGGRKAPSRRLGQERDDHHHAWHDGRRAGRSGCEPDRAAVQDERRPRGRQPQAEVDNGTRNKTSW